MQSINTFVLTLRKATCVSKAPATPTPPRHVRDRCYLNYSIPLGSTLLPQRLKDAGYATYGFGKWNVGHCNASYLPTARGFVGYFTAGIDYTTHATSPLVTAPGSTNGTSRVDVDALFVCSGCGASAADSDTPASTRTRSSRRRRSTRLARTARASRAT